MVWLVSFALLWAVAVVTPGPNFLLVTGTALDASRRHGIATVAGLLTGTTIWGFAGFFGVGLLFRAAPWIYLSLKVAGGAYIVYLGIKMLRGSGAHADAESRNAPRSLWRAYRRGIVTNLSNPKSGAFVTTIFAATIPAHPTALDGLAALATMLTISASWYGLVVWGLGLGSVQSLYLRARRGIERGVGVLFVAFGIDIAVNH